MNREIEIMVNEEHTKMKLPPDLQDSKIVVENDKVFVNTGVIDYINNLKFDNKKLKEENRRLKECAEDTYFTSQEIIKELEKENQRLNNVLNELKEDISHLLDIINRNEREIKIYQDEWLAVSSFEYKLKELKESDK